jgi:hypothetical protein
MKKGTGCESDLPGLAESSFQVSQYGKESFPNGIVNGQEWYPVAGGMQDWNYVHTNCMEITVEIGCIKYPDEKYLEDYWEANKLPITEFILQSRIGLLGIVSDSEGWGEQMSFILTSVFLIFLQ